MTNSKKIVVIDGQGGKLGCQIIEQLKSIIQNITIYAIGTNSIATTTMLKAGATYGATGENPVIVHCRDADIIIGPLGIAIADSLLGEITPAMSVAIGQSAANKILLPLNRCNNFVVCTQDRPIPELVSLAISQVKTLLDSIDQG